MNCPRCNAPMAVVENRVPVNSYAGLAPFHVIERYRECVRCNHAEPMTAMKDPFWSTESE